MESIDATTLDQLRRIDRAARDYVEAPGHGNFSRLSNALLDGRVSGDKIRKAVSGDIIPTGNIIPPLWIPAPDWRELLQRCVEGWQGGADVSGPMFSAINALKLQRYPYHPDPYGKTRERPHCRTCACGLVPDLSAISVTAVRISEFKNFHRLLCDRFGYVHDEKDWRCDQLSLIEHIAKCRLDAEYEQIGVLNYSYEGASGEPVYRKRKAP